MKTRKEYWIKKRKTEIKGSFTVEAALILPIILSIIFSLFYVVFYVHDKVRAETGLYQTLRATEQEIYVRKIGYKWEDKHFLFDQGFFLLRKESESNEKGVIFIKEKITMKGRCSIVYLEQWLKSIRLEFKRSLRMVLYNPTELLRFKESLLEDETEDRVTDKQLEYEQKKIERIKDLMR